MTEQSTAFPWPKVNAPLLAAGLPSAVEPAFQVHPLFLFPSPPISEMMVRSEALTACHGHRIAVGKGHTDVGIPPPE